ncbi:MAG: tRNA guanosine(34) transglycosylase Tgt [Thermodesulfobacteriota bacterium]|nr:tRNA guanosine(34) transglycosylase Tgt [Thermodesulfobacteriota bacterium]
MRIGEFTLKARDGRARAGTLMTAHGLVETPAFMPVGTLGSVKSLSPHDLLEVGAQIILGNSYHLYLRPGDELIARRGGLHKFMGWDRPLLTDSGGFQVFSLSALRTISPDGVTFKSHLDGSTHVFSPEKVIAIQKNLGSDIMMVLDECAPYGADREYTEKSIGLTADWARRCRETYPPGAGEQLLFGIVQGGFFKDLREMSAEQILAIPFDGYALGGFSVGESREEMREVLGPSAGLLPEDRPRYLMGVGAPPDILDAVEKGMDMFDCVLPTRNARNGTLFTSKGVMNIKNARYAEDDKPVDESCSCYACAHFSRAYLRHLYMARELLSYRLNTIHNLAFFLGLMRDVRKAISNGTFAALKRRIDETYKKDPESGQDS